MCSSGNQAVTATRNAGYPGDPADPEAADARRAEGFFLLEGVLPMTIGDLQLETCEDARSLLDKRDLNGRERASDAAYSLAAQLIAAQANFAAGATVCDDVLADIDAANGLLSDIGFDGVGRELPPSRRNDPDRALALMLAESLDDYNNGLVC
jgi:hypothetical protein